MYPKTNASHISHITCMSEPPLLKRHKSYHTSSSRQKYQMVLPKYTVNRLVGSTIGFRTAAEKTVAQNRNRHTIVRRLGWGAELRILLWLMRRSLSKLYPVPEIVLASFSGCPVSDRRHTVPIPVLTIGQAHILYYMFYLIPVFGYQAVLLLLGWNKLSSYLSTTTAVL